MGVVPVVLVILALKIPIFGLLWLVWWAGRTPQAERPDEEPVRGRPLRPRPTLPGRPRRRDPHGGGAAAPVPAPRRGGHRQHPAPAVSPAPSGSAARER